MALILHKCRRIAYCSGALALATAGAWLALARPSSRSDVKLPPGYGSVFESLLAQYPIPVNTSPDGHRVLVKTRGGAGFTLAILDRETGRTLASTTSADTQLALTWDPDGEGVAYLASPGGNGRFQLHFWDLRSGRVSQFPLPAITTAARPLRFTPNGDRLILATGDEDGGTLLAVHLGSDRGTWDVVGQIHPESGFAISPSGRWIAFVPDDRPNAVAVKRFDALPQTPMMLDVLGSGVVRDLAWAPGESRMLATARREGAERFALYELDRTRFSARLVAALPADIEHPRYGPRAGFALCEASAGGLSRIVRVDLQAPSVRFLATPPSLARLQEASTEEGEVIALVSPLGGPPELAALDLTGAPPRPVWRNAASRATAVLPEFVDVPIGIGQAVPCFVWKPKRAAPKTAVIVVHGGPKRHASPKWDPAVQEAVARGIAVAIVNYHGSTGYGWRYERENRTDAQAADVLAVSRHLAARYGVARDRQIILGESIGNAIAYRAAARSRESFLGMVMVAPTAVPAAPLAIDQTPLFIHLYQGENDPLRRSVDIRRVGEAVASHDGDRPVLVRTVDGEGHNFHRTATWSEVYARTFAMCKPESLTRPDSQGR